MKCNNCGEEMIEDYKLKINGLIGMGFKNE